MLDKRGAHSRTLSPPLISKHSHSSTHVPKPRTQSNANVSHSNSVVASVHGGGCVVCRWCVRNRCWFRNHRLHWCRGHGAVRSGSRWLLGWCCGSFGRCSSLALWCCRHRCRLGLLASRRLVSSVHCHGLAILGSCVGLTALSSHLAFWCGSRSCLFSSRLRWGSSSWGSGSCWRGCNRSGFRAIDGHARSFLAPVRLGVLAIVTFIPRVAQLFVAHHPLVRLTHGDACVRVVVVLIVTVLKRNVHHVLHLDARSAFHVAKVLNELRGKLLQVLRWVLVFHVARSDVQAKIWAKVLEIIVVWQLFIDFCVKCDSSFVRPAACDVAYCVTTATKKKHWFAKRLDKLNTGSVAFEREVEAAEAIARKGISTTLQHDDRGPVPVHALLNNRLENALVRFVINAVSEGKVDCIVLSLPMPNILDVAGARKVLSVLVKRHRHHSVGAVKCLFHTVAVMNVNVNVQHALMSLEELEDGEDNVVDIAKSRGL
eukprot:m.78637 g.78637  ORF g.78637 m.78637 type:complete len:485 (+) comp14592_c0_seq3:64-1518(+)